MQIDNLSLFPTLVQVVKDFLTHQQCNDILQLVLNGEEKMPPHEIFFGAAVSSHISKGRVSLLDNLAESVDSCVDVKINLQNQIDNFCKEAGIPKSVFSNSWANIQKPNSILKEHTHAGSSVSGVIFLKSDEKSNKLFFHNPNQIIGMVNNKNSAVPYMWDWYSIEPVVGTLVIFPGWLKHGSNYTMNGPTKRVVLGFNAVLNNQQLIESMI